MRRIDELPAGSYELELLRECAGGRGSSGRTHGAPQPCDAQLAREAGGGPYRVLRVIGTYEEVLDTTRDTIASPGARFRARVQGLRDVSVRRV